MKKKSLKLLIKRQKILIEQLTARLNAKKEEIERLAKKKAILLESITGLDNQEVQNVAAFAATKEYLFDLYKQIEAIEPQLKSLNQELEVLKKELSEKFSEKKAFEKLLAKIQEQETQKEIFTESRLADESFARKFITGR